MGAAFHVDLWRSYIYSIDPYAVIAIRSRRLFCYLCAVRPELNLYYIKSGREVEKLVRSCPNLRGVLYTSNTGNTIHFLRFNHLRHVLVGHGDSDKAASCYKFFRAYDEMWVAGRAQIDRFRNAGFNHSSLRFKIVGRPMARHLLQVRRTQPQGKCFLYLPTWEGYQADQNYSSADIGMDFIPRVAGLCERKASIKLHPWTGTQDKSLRRAGKEVRRRCEEQRVCVSLAAKDTPVETLMQEADFLIADISSVVTDFLCTGRPIFLYVPTRRELRLSESCMTFEKYCYTFSDVGQLLDQVREVVMEGRDELAQARVRALEYFIDIRCTAEHQFEQELERLYVRNISSEASSAPSRAMNELFGTSLK